MVDAMTQADSPKYIQSGWRYRTGMHKNRYGMIKLLNGEIAFLRGELSREL